MRAPLSKLAKEILDNPESARQLKEWVDSGQREGRITLTGVDGGVCHIRAKRLNTTEATHGYVLPKRTLGQRVKNIFHSVLALFIGPA